MNRPIKFRVWDKKNNLYIPERQGYQYDIKTIGFDGSIRSQYYSTHEQLPDDYVIQQFTGLLDVNGKEIYEGDIISFDVYEPHDQALDHITNAEVFWDSEYLNWSFGRFENKMYSPPYKYSYEMTSGIKKDSFLVTGNIFENPLDKLNPQVNIKPAS
jgi:uncharacterized phage protein (TIGR01671 family)